MQVGRLLGARHARFVMEVKSTGDARRFGYIWLTRCWLAMWYNENYLRCPYGHEKGSPVKSRRGSATVSEGKLLRCATRPVELGKAKRPCSLQTATSEPGDLPERTSRLLRRTGRCMIARVFFSFGRSRPFLLRRLTAARSQKMCVRFCSWWRRRALPLRSSLGVILSSLDGAGVLAPDEVNRLPDVRANLNVKRASGL
jgi:hypothetical protein